MKRRAFVRASLLTGTFAGMIPLLDKANETSNRQKKQKEEFYELSVYSLKNDTQQKLMEDYLQHAAIPALNRLGSKNIGVFTEMKPQGQTKIYVITPFNSLSDFTAAAEKLATDDKYRQAGMAYLTAPATDPAYERIENSLLKAFNTMPRMKVPPGKQRIFELRRYESHSEAAGKKKIEMFNKGEIGIFERVGLTPVFFGETIIGPVRPNLTYMITYDDMDEHARSWKTFINDPEWIKLKSIPDYADKKIVSKITSVLLVPTAYSQV